MPIEQNEILEQPDKLNSSQESADHKPLKVRKSEVKKIAVILPIQYKGGVLRGLKNTAKMIHGASRQIGEPVGVVIAIREDAYDLETEFAEEMREGIEIREIRPRLLGPEATATALRWAGVDASTHDFDLTVHYRDGVSDLLDCDLWIFITNRTYDEYGVVRPVLPVRKIVAIPYDFIEQYVPEVLTPTFRQAVAESTRSADLVLVTQPQTGKDAVSSVGCDPNRVVQVPFEFEISKALASIAPGPHPDISRSSSRTISFVWPTNTSIHKNHLTVFRGLRIAVDRGIAVRGCMTGPFTDTYLDNIESAATKLGGTFTKAWEEFQNLKMLDSLQPKGYLSESTFAEILSEADFALHSSTYDNGAYALVEAAYLGVPSICSDYPQSRYLAETLQIPAIWFKPNDPEDFARAIQEMTETFSDLRSQLPPPEDLRLHDWRSIAVDWWKCVKNSLNEVDR